jgi:hypothetical protein
MFRQRTWYTVSISQLLRLFTLAKRGRKTYCSRVLRVWQPAGAHVKIIAGVSGSDFQAFLSLPSLRGNLKFRPCWKTIHPVQLPDLFMFIMPRSELRA